MSPLGSGEGICQAEGTVAAKAYGGSTPGVCEEHEEGVLTQAGWTCCRHRVKTQPPTACPGPQDVSFPAQGKD